MKSAKRTRQFYLFALAARLIVFVILVLYAVKTPSAQFLADVEAGITRFTPVSIAWLGLVICMIFRLFPSRIESLGCQKIYVNKFDPSGKDPTEEDLRTGDKSALRSFLFWIALNAVFFVAYWFDIADERFMVCLAGFYSVVDIFCILFFCPFQSWFMHNRCCTTCRIFDWDYLMICTPLLAFPNAVTLSASAIAFIIFLRWELVYARNKERFYETSNCSLKCSRCEEHLCQYKRTLASAVKAKKPTHSRR